MLGFELCFNLVLVDKDLGEHSFVKIFEFFSQFCFRGKNKTLKWRKKRKGKVGEEKKNLGEFFCLLLLLRIKKLMLY
jgi:hypothetical protein